MFTAEKPREREKKNVDIYMLIMVNYEYYLFFLLSLIFPSLPLGIRLNNRNT